jgi:hypothetical protein
VLSLLITELSPLLAELSLLVVELWPLLTELSPLVAELSPLLAELSSLIVAELSSLIDVELSLLKPRLQPCSGTGLANTSCLRPPSMLYSSTTRPVLGDCLLDYPTSAPPRPPDQRSGTASSTTRPALRDYAFDHPTSARGFVDHVSRCAQGLLRPLSDHSLRPTAQGLIFRLHVKFDSHTVERSFFS